MFVYCADYVKKHSFLHRCAFLLHFKKVDYQVGKKEKHFFFLILISSPYFLALEKKKKFFFSKPPFPFNVLSAFFNLVARLTWRPLNPPLYPVIRQDFCYQRSYILSVFAYCPLIWMFCGIKGNNLINKTHKRALKAVYQNYDLSLLDLLSIDNEVTIHVKNLRFLMAEVYKSLNCLNPEFILIYFYFLFFLTYNLYSYIFNKHF